MKINPRLPLFRPSSALTSKSNFHLTKPHPVPIRHPPQTRHFSNPLTPLQTLTASRILPYHSAPLYNLIADIQSYPQFIPYCTSSSITSHSAPEKETKRRWPRTADLQIGYAGYEERFRSAVYCLPYTVLEAVAGAAKPTIPRSQLQHYYSENPSHPPTADENENAAGNEKIFTSLLTRWNFKEFPFKPAPPDGKSPQEPSAATPPSSPRTEITLTIEVQFASAMYSALSQAAAPKVAGMMIEAMEKRAAEMFGEAGGRGRVSGAERDGEVGAMEGVTRGKKGIMGGLA